MRSEDGPDARLPGGSNAAATTGSPRRPRRGDEPLKEPPPPAGRGPCRRNRSSSAQAFDERVPRAAGPCRHRTRGRPPELTIGFAAKRSPVDAGARDPLVAEALVGRTPAQWPKRSSALTAATTLMQGAGRPHREATSSLKERGHSLTHRKGGVSRLTSSVSAASVARERAGRRRAGDWRQRQPAIRESDPLPRCPECLDGCPSQPRHSAARRLL